MQVDRISNLEDKVLVRILSFLDTKEAVKTSILSKRWEFLWTSIPKVEFKENHSFDSRRFIGFVRRVLLLHDPNSLETFSLSCKVPLYDYGYKPPINMWISSVLFGHEDKLQKMILNLQFEEKDASFKLYSGLFACTSLRELTLDFHSHLWLPSSIGLPNLGVLTLSQLIFMNQDSVKKLFSGCPKLEKLYLIECDWDKVNTICVSSPKLKHLEIHEAEDHSRYCCQFKISGPSLEAFHYLGRFKNNYLFCEVPSLVRAHIDVYNGTCLKKQTAARSLKLLRGLANVKNLRLSSLSLCVENKSEQEPSLPEFPSLNHLEVDCILTGFDFTVLYKIIHNSPQLGSIYFGERTWDSLVGKAYNWKVWDLIPPCFSTHLKTVKIAWCSVTDEDQATALKTIFSSAKALERIDLYSKHKIPYKIRTGLRINMKCNVVMH